jgi:hypothetical protein
MSATLKFGIYAAPNYLARAGERDLKHHDWVMAEAPMAASSSSQP